MMRAIRAAKPDMVYVASYPPDTVGILRAVNEIGVGDSVKIFGGGMVGAQFTSNMETLGSLLNGVVNYNSWLPEPSMQFPGVKEFLDKYAPRAAAAKADALGYYLAPFGYASGQLIEAAVNATKSLDDKVLAKYLRENDAPDHRRPDRSSRTMANARKQRPCSPSSVASSTRTWSSSACPANRSSCSPTS